MTTPQEIVFPEPNPEFIPTKGGDLDCLAFAARVHTRPELMSRVLFDCFTGKLSANNVYFHVDLDPDSDATIFRGEWIPDDESRKRLEKIIMHQHGIIPFKDATYAQKVAALCTVEHPEHARVFPPPPAQ